MARHTVAFAYTGGAQSVVIPSNYAGSFQFDAAAGQGGAGGGAQGGVGGLGGRVTGTYSPAIGDTINVYVGGKGGPGSEDPGGSPSRAGGTAGYGYHSGGAGGGGSDSSGGGGGGSSALLDGATLIAEAGGGGGAGGAAGPNYNTVAGGAGGASPVSGTIGNNVGGSGYAAAGGGAHATSSAGGAGGSAGTAFGGLNGTAGSAGTGTAGGTGGLGYEVAGVNETDGGGGGGGGGHFGGGGGGGAGQAMNGGGGGGGLSYQGAAATISFNDNYQSGNGYVNVSWQTLPVSSPSAPTGTITTTSQPTITASYSSADSAPMQAYRIAVYSAAQTMPAAPSIAASPVWDSGVVFATGSSISVTPGTLPNGNLVAYVAFQDSAGGDSLWSTWASTSWTEAAPQPATPIATVTPLPSTARVNLSMSALDNLLAANDADFEGGIGTWVARDAATIAQSTAQSQSGTHSLAITAASPAGHSSANTANGTAGYKCRGGATYTCMASFRAAATARACTAYMLSFDATGALLDIGSGATVTDSTTGWVTASSTLTTSSTAVYLAVIAQINGPVNGEVHYVDEVGIFCASGINLLGSSPTWNPYSCCGGGAVNPTLSVDSSGTWPDGGPPEKVNAETASGNAWSGMMAPSQSVTNGVQYTVACWMKGDAIAAASSGFGFYTPDNQAPAVLTPITQNWQRVTFTWTGTGGVGNLIFRWGGYGTVWIAGAVFVVGATAPAANNLIGGWSAGGSYPTYFTVQRSLDGGTTWTTVQGGSQVTNIGGAVSFDDIGAPREQTITYRVQSVAVSGGNSFVSQWSLNQSAYVSSDGQDWLFCVGNRALSTPITYQGPNLSALSHEDQAAYWPEGRSDAVVFHGTIHLEQFTSGIGSQLLTFAFKNDAAWNNFKAMRATQQPLLLKSVYGDTGREQWWLVLAADAGTTRFGGGDKAFAGNGQTNQIRTVQMGAYQVKEPA